MEKKLEENFKQHRDFYITEEVLQVLDDLNFEDQDGFLSNV